MTTEKLRIGMAQMLVVGGQPATNLERAATFIRDAAAKACRLVVLPECLDLGWTHPSVRLLAQPIPGPHAERLAQSAKQHGIYVVAGLVERAGERLYNAAVLIDPRGELLLVHRKINELDIAQDLYSIGDRLAVAHTELGSIGVTICADNFPDSLAISSTLARMGAQMILSPSAWAVDADHDNQREPYGELWRRAYGELGRLFDLPVISVSCAAAGSSVFADKDCPIEALAVEPPKANIEWIVERFAAKQVRLTATVRTGVAPKLCQRRHLTARQSQRRIIRRPVRVEKLDAHGRSSTVYFPFAGVAKPNFENDAPRPRHQPRRPRYGRIDWQLDADKLDLRITDAIVVAGTVAFPRADRLLPISVNLPPLRSSRIDGARAALAHDRFRSPQLDAPNRRLGSNLDTRRIVARNHDKRLLGSRFDTVRLSRRDCCQSYQDKSMDSYHNVYFGFRAASGTSVSNC